MDNVILRHKAKDVLVFVEATFFPVDLNCALDGSVGGGGASEGVEEGALSGSRGPHDCIELGVFELSRDSRENGRAVFEHQSKLRELD